MNGLTRVLSRILKVLAGVGGTVDVLIVAVREATIAVERVVAVFIPRVESKLIPVTEKIFDFIKKIWDNTKRFFLDMDPQ